MASAYYTYIFTNLVRSFSQLFLSECGVVLMGADPPDPRDAWEEPRGCSGEGGREAGRGVTCCLESKGKIFPNNSKGSNSKSSF